MTTPSLTDSEVEILVLSLMESRGSAGATQEEMMQVIDWATQVRADQALLNLTLHGELIVAIDHGELVFRKRQG